MPEQPDLEKLRQFCRKLLEPDLQAFFDEFKQDAGYDERDTNGKLLVIDIVWGVFYHEYHHRIARARREAERLPEPFRFRAQVVLDVYREVIRDFFTRLRAEQSN